jgi:DNA-binding response OmpR family regulator
MPADQLQPLVLVVEDDADIRDLVRYRLERTGYRVITAPDGEIGLALALEHTPDLAILDVMMPKMDGLQLASQLKADARLRGVPIIFLTGRDSPKDVVQGINMGARHYLTKPFKIPDLLAKVAKTLGPKR